jgi:hypothetical protein
MPHLDALLCKHLAQGFGTQMPSDTNTCFFIPKSNVPHNQKVTYGPIMASIGPQRKETHNCLNYRGATSTPTAKLTTAKCVLNSAILTPNGCFMLADKEDFYLNRPLKWYKYVRLPIALILDKIIQQYQLQQLATPDSWVYIKIQKGMYGLKQAGILAKTPGLWKHATGMVSFSLVVDNFGIKHVGRENAPHLANALAALYKVATDWAGKLYCGLTIQWNYPKHQMHRGSPTEVPTSQPHHSQRCAP